MDTPAYSRDQLQWTEPLNVGPLKCKAEEILAKLSTHLTIERRARLDAVVARRSRLLVPVLENIYDRGNVSAVMRSAEAFGFLRMDLVDAPGARFKAANRVTKGADKWLDVRTHHEPLSAIAELKASGYQIWATDLATEFTIDNIDFLRPTAIVLGNEKEGVSAEMLRAVDGRFRLPMLGFSQSFNISVAAALIFYHAHLRQRELGDRAFLNEAERELVLANYFLRTFDNPEALLRAHLQAQTKS